MYSDRTLDGTIIRGDEGLHNVVQRSSQLKLVNVAERCATRAQQ
jgi:hypothetical protein